MISIYVVQLVISSSEKSDVTFTLLLKVRQKYTATRRIFNSLLGVRTCVETCLSCLKYHLKFK